MNDKELLELAQAYRREPCKANYDAMAGAVRALVGEAEKSERRANMFAGIFSNYTIAMQAALIDAELKSQLEGMSWIFNTLAGPGLLPDVDVAKAMGGAQAWFDAKMEEEVARVALYAHQQPKAEPLQEPMPDCWAVVKDGSVIGTHDAPCHLDGIQAVRYIASAPQAKPLTWQPIETAPKDFVTIFDGWNSERVADVIWAHPEYTPKGYHAFCVSEYTNGHGWDNVEVKGLTHWMPLPSAPDAYGIGGGV